MLCTGVLYMLSHELCSVPVQPPIFKMYTSEILYETESSFEIMFSELKMSGKGQTFCLLLIYCLKHSTEQKSHFTKL